MYEGVIGGADVMRQDHMRNATGLGVGMSEQIRPADSKPPKLLVQFNRLDDSLCRLEEAMRMLEQRLQPVMSPANPAQAKEAGGTIGTPESVIVNKIGHVNHRVCCLVNQVMDIQQALEI